MRRTDFFWQDYAGKGKCPEMKSKIERMNRKINRYDRYKIFKYGRIGAGDASVGRETVSGETNL